MALSKDRLPIQYYLNVAKKNNGYNFMRKGTFPFSAEARGGDIAVAVTM